MTILDELKLFGKTNINDPDQDLMDTFIHRCKWFEDHFYPIRKKELEYRLIVIGTKKDTNDLYNQIFEKKE